MEKITIDQPFEMDIHVRPEDIDELGHVNNVIYLKWVQDVATAHWNAASPNGHNPTSVIWVVIQHEIRYKQPTYLGDVVTARTWIGKAITLWTPVDKETGKSVEIEADVLGLFLK